MASWDIQNRLIVAVVGTSSVLCSKQALLDFNGATNSLYTLSVHGQHPVHNVHSKIIHVELERVHLSIVLIYNFSYSGKPNHDYLIICKKDFPNVNFEIKGYYYPQELQDGLSEIFLITNKGMYIKDARAIGLDVESDETEYKNFFAIAKFIFEPFFRSFSCKQAVKAAFANFVWP